MFTKAVSEGLTFFSEVQNTTNSTTLGPPQPFEGLPDWAHWVFIGLGIVTVGLCTVALCCAGHKPCSKTDEQKPLLPTTTTNIPK